MSSKDVVVCGYPRSGNTWVSRLLGDYLNSPVMGYANAVPLATEGKLRTGEYTVRQLHLLPVDNYHEKFLIDGWECNINAYDEEHLIFVTRDPRDVAVSAMHYWDKTLDEILDAMCRGVHPLAKVGRWTDYNEAWMNTMLPVTWVSYEELVSNGAVAFFRLLSRAGLTKRYTKEVVDSFERQSIDNKRKRIEWDGDKRPYGKTIQLKHLRKGISGDYKNYFDAEQLAIARECFGGVAKQLGYKL